jgi:hypothetical protein
VAAETLDLARDCLDNRLLDRLGAPIGRVDSIVLAQDGRGPPRVVAIEAGMTARARRVHPRIGRWAARMARRFGHPEGGLHRRAWQSLSWHGRDCISSLEAAGAPTRAWERWLRDHVIGRIPGA